MRLGTGLRNYSKHHDRPLPTMDQKVFPSWCLHFLHWKEDLAITAVRSPETRALLGPDSGHGKSQGELPTMKEQRNQFGMKLSLVLPKPVPWGCDGFSLSFWSVGYGQLRLNILLLKSVFLILFIINIYLTIFSLSCFFHEMRWARTQPMKESPFSKIIWKTKAPVCGRWFLKSYLLL